MGNDKTLKYYIRRKKGTSGLYLAARPRVQESEIQRNGRQGLPSSVETPTSSPQPQQEYPPSPPQTCDVVTVESHQPALRRKSNSIAKNSRRDTGIDTRRVRFSLPEEPDVVYPGALPNLRVLRAQFDGISADEEECTETHWREVLSRRSENRYRSTTPAKVGEYSSTPREEPIPKSILKNSRSPPPANPRPARSHGHNQHNQHNQYIEHNQAPKTFFYAPLSRNDDLDIDLDRDLDRDQNQPTRTLRVLRPPPLPENRVMYDSERKPIRAKRHVRFATELDDTRKQRPGWHNAPAPAPPLRSRDIPQKSSQGWHKPVKPLPAYAKSEEEEARDQQGAIEW